MNCRYHPIAAIPGEDSLRVAEDACYAFGEARPALLLRRQLLLAGGRECVEPRLAILLGHAPIGAKPSVLFHPVERGVQRPFLDAEQVGGCALDVRRDGVAVHATLGRQGLEAVSYTHLTL